MKSKYSNRRIAVWSCALFAILWSLQLVAKEAKGAASAKSSTQSEQRAMVGSDTCKACHEDQFKTVQGTAHFRNFHGQNAGAKDAYACETCHGGGEAHVEAGGDKTKIFTFKNVKPEEATERCMQCHETNLEHAGFNRSAHNKNGVTCISCHSPHNAKAEHLLVRKSPDLCFSCHNETRGDFMKPFHHKVNEGFVQCQDCHNVHGEQAKQLRNSAQQDALCYKCHSDKRGPFVFEHEPVRTEGCAACHTPHGSTNPRLLTRARVNSLCLECHQNFYSGPHPQNTKSQNCTWCHVGIHGSNTSNVFFQ